MYSIQQLASLAGTTTRTLRHYDAIGLLVANRDVNGYRRYSSRDAERLQLILQNFRAGKPTPLGVG